MLVHFELHFQTKTTEVGEGVWAQYL